MSRCRGTRFALLSPSSPPHGTLMDNLGLDSEVYHIFKNGTGEDTSTQMNIMYNTLYKHGNKFNGRIYCTKKSSFILLQTRSRLQSTHLGLTRWR